MDEQLICSHIHYAHAIAAELASKYYPNIARADLVGAAELGLVQAARSYDPSRRASFATFAYYRVRGAILDEVRKSWRASNLGSQNDAVVLTSAEQCHDARDVACGFLENSTFSMANGYVTSLAGSILDSIPDPKESPASEFLRKEESRIVFDAIRDLPNRHRFVLQAHYYDDLSLVSISRKLKLSKSRVSRIHAQALSMVRKMLRDSRRVLSNASQSKPSD
jgi:RNA polymerase sigma factor for flagellar operon FliA